MRKRQYGSVKKRGICKPLLERIQKKSKARSDREATYVVKLGTALFYRDAQKKGRWFAFEISVEKRFEGYLWRNATHWGFLLGAYEYKVKVGQFEKLHVQ